MDRDSRFKGKGREVKIGELVNGDPGLVPAMPRPAPLITRVKTEDQMAADRWNKRRRRRERSSSHEQLAAAADSGLMGTHVRHQLAG